MRLRNKKTGEIGELSAWRRQDTGEFTGLCVLRENEKFPTGYKNLAELNEEWEDYEEQKEFWYIGQDGVIFSDTDTITQDYANRLESIGNYFETEEEAKKAVEKLKAWKQLKDKGFEFADYYTIDGYTVHIKAGLSDRTKALKYLDLLFSGGEE